MDRTIGIFVISSFGLSYQTPNALQQPHSLLRTTTYSVSGNHASKRVGLYSDARFTAIDRLDGLASMLGANCADDFTKEEGGLGLRGAKAVTHIRHKHKQGSL